MDFAKKASGSKKQQPNVNRDQRGNYGRSNQSGNQPLYSAHFSRRQNEEESSRTSKRDFTGNQPLYSAHFSRRQNEEESSRTRVLRPPPLFRPNLKEYSKITGSSHQSKFVTKKQETAEEKKERLKSQLNQYESPFKWRPRQVKPLNEPETIINRMVEKDREVKDDRKFKWRNFIFHLVISYELWRAKKLSEAFEEIRGLESELSKRTNHGDYFFTCIESALWHVVNASKAFLYLEQNMVDEAEGVVGNIKPIEIMTRQNKAGIHGIQAAMFMEYGHRGNKNALDEAMEAVKLDRTNAEWHFFIGKCLGRIRRVACCHNLVNHEEVKAMNKATKLDERNATYKVFLAQVLSERAFRQYKNHHPERKSEQSIKIIKTNKAAMHAFKDAVKLSPKSPHILIRCARGLMKLPPSLRDLKFTKDCIDKAVELAPNNPMVHHVQAMYHERFDCDAELPLQAYEKAASLDNFGAAMDLIRLHHKLKNGDIIEELDDLATKFEQIDRRQVVYAQAGSYLLFIKKDIIGALKYYLKAIEIDPKSYAMMSHKPIFFRMRDPVNMFDVLLEELETKTDFKSFAPEDQKIIRRFMIGTMEHKALPNEKKKRLTVEEILEMSRNVVVEGDLYKERQAMGRRRNYLYRQLRKGKRWHGKKKSVPKDIKVKSSANEKLYPNEKMCSKGEIKKSERKHINTNVEPKRRDSVSSVGSVDSDYHRDSTKFGPRGFFLQGSNESLCSKKSETFGSHTNLQHQSLDLPTVSSIPGGNGYRSKCSRDSSISSMSSACSSVDFVSDQDSKMMYPHGKTTVENQLSFENVKRLDLENSYDTGIQRLSMLSLSGGSSVSQASSLDSLSVMDRVKQSYAMLGRSSEPPSQGKKKHSKKYGSTQSLNTQHKSNWERGNKNIRESGSTQSLNKLEENLDKKYSKFKSRDSSMESTRSLSFMPSFACKNSQSDNEK